MLHIAWVGDSQVVLGKNGAAVKLMDPHKPDREVQLVINFFIYIKYETVVEVLDKQ